MWVYIHLLNKPCVRKLVQKTMEDDNLEKEPVHLLEDQWFFGNLLKTKAKMVRCNSDPAPRSTKGEKNDPKSGNLLRAPSLPPNLGTRERDWGEFDGEDAPRMADLIRQAMPCVKKEVTGPVNNVLSKGPTTSKLTRRSSMDSPLPLPPKHSSKGAKQRRSETLPRNVSKPKSLGRSMSLKTLSHDEVRGFQDLGFTFNKQDLSTSVANKLAGLEIKEESEPNPSLLEAWNAAQSSSSSSSSQSPAIPTWLERKGSPQDMKAQIKFWARAVASNVRQEC